MTYHYDHTLGYHNAVNNNLNEIILQLSSSFNVFPAKDMIGPIKFKVSVSHTNIHTFNINNDMEINLLIFVCLALQSATTLAITIAFRTKSLSIADYYLPQHIDI